MMSFCDVTWWHDIMRAIMLRCNMTSHHRSGFRIMPFKSEKSKVNCLKIPFHHLVTLTYDLDQDIVQVDFHEIFYVFTLNGSDVRVRTHKHMHTQTGSILLPQPLIQEVIKVPSYSETYFHWSIDSQIQRIGHPLWHCCHLLTAILHKGQQRYHKRERHL